MPWFEIYNTDTDEFGRKLTSEQLKEIVDNYDSEYREAPLTIDHKEEGPSFGWVKELMLRGRSIFARIEEISEKMKQAINEGMFKKISMAWVTIKNKGLYLWHVSLLGTGKPAVASLAPVSLSANTWGMRERPEDVIGPVESRTIGIWPEPFLKLARKVAAVPSEIPLADEGEAWSWSWADDADAIIERYGWKGLAQVCAYVNRDFETDQKEDGLPAVKGAYKLPFAKIIGGQLKVVWRGVAAAMAALMGARDGVILPEEDRRKAFNILARQYKRFDKPAPEFKSIKEGGSEMAEAELQKKVTDLETLLKQSSEEAAKIKGEKETLERRHAELSGQVEREREEAWVKTQINEGKILPAWEEKGLVEFMLSLDSQQIETKSADGNIQKIGQREMFKSLVESLAAVIDFNEIATANRAAQRAAAAEPQQKVEVKKGETLDQQMAELDRKATEYAVVHKVSYEQAVEALKSGM